MVFVLAKTAQMWYDDFMKTNEMKQILSKLPDPLLEWYRENARDLPWRHTGDPYRIWVSEIMLQQTRVAAVLGYYDRFLQHFPTVQDLAFAPEETLMKCWEGLGYYSRARNLQKAAKMVVEVYNGTFPETYEELLKLPGIGEYTAGAIASSAFAVPIPAVDGNVLRVVARITDCHEDIAGAKVCAAFREQLAEIFPSAPEDICIFNQALMELGATVCVPNGVPKCEECPAGEFCFGRARGTMKELPVKSPKKARKVEEKTVFVLLKDREVALRKRGTSGLLAGLWEFPNVEGILDETAAQEVLKAWHLTAVDWKKRLTAKHIFTHVEWHMVGYILKVEGNPPPGMLWADIAALDTLAVPSAFSRYYEEVRNILRET